MHQTPTAVVALNDDRIVTVRVRPGVVQTVSDAEKNLAAALELRDGQRRPILVDIRDAVPLDADVRRYYSGHVLVGFTCMALLIRASPLGRMIGNVYLRIANTGIPTRLFTDEGAALQWLEKLGDEAALTFARKRVHAILAGLEAIAAGDFAHKLPLSSKEDELDAIAHAINVIADELQLARDHKERS